MKIYSTLFPALILSLILTACGAVRPAATATPSASSTPDLCSPPVLQVVVGQMNNLTRQFDDDAALAANTPQAQLVQVIPHMQAVRRAAEDFPAPACLQNLKRFQLLFMNTTIQTLLAFQSKADANTLAKGIALSRQYHDQYTLELARLLGLTVVAPPSVTPGAQAPQLTVTPPPVAFVVVNPSANPINLHISASLTSETVGSLGPGQSAPALGRSPTGEWILIQVPGGPAPGLWVYATLVQFSSGTLAGLPVVAP